MKVVLRSVILVRLVLRKRPTDNTWKIPYHKSLIQFVLCVSVDCFVMLLKLALILTLPVTISSTLYCFHVPNNRQLSFHQCSESLASQTYNKISGIYGIQPRRKRSDFFKCVDLNTTLGESFNIWLLPILMETSTDPPQCPQMEKRRTTTSKDASTIPSERVISDYLSSFTATRKTSIAKFARLTTVMTTLREQQLSN